MKPAGWWFLAAGVLALVACWCFWVGAGWSGGVCAGCGMVSLGFGIGASGR